MAALDLTLDVRQPGRLASAGFIAFWLCGWVVGELGALFALVTGNFGQSLELAAPAFLMLWLLLWTFGGIAAARKLVELLSSRVHLRVEGQTLLVDRPLLGFTRHLRFGRAEVKGVRAKSDKSVVLELESGRERVLFRTLDARAAREAVEGIRWGLDLVTPRERVVAPAWAEAVELPNGHVILHLHRRALRLAAFALWPLAAVLSGAALHQTLTAPQLPWGLWLCLALSLMAAAQCTWGRTRWLLQRGQLVREKRWGARVTEVQRFDRPVLVVTSSTDSDSDTRWRLEVTQDERSLPLMQGATDEDDVRDFARYLARVVAIAVP